MFDLDSYFRSWQHFASVEPFFQELNSHYARFESRPAGFVHRGRFFFGDVIELNEFPGPGYSTLLTKGLSGFCVDAPEEGSKVRVELAWTIKQRCVCEEAVGILVGVADFLLGRRTAFHQNEVVEFDFSGLPRKNHLSSFLASNGHWFSEGDDEIKADIPMYILELFAVNESEAKLAMKDIDEFSDVMISNEVGPEDLWRTA